MPRQKLGLSVDQTAKIDPVLADRQQKMMALQSDTTLTPQQKHRQMRPTGKDSEQQLAVILTPDQMQQMKSMHHGHGEGRGEAYGHHPAPLTGL